MKVKTVDNETHDANYIFKRETTRDKVYFTTYRKHATEDIAFYSGNTMTGIVRKVDDQDLRRMIEKANKSDSQ